MGVFTAIVAGSVAGRRAARRELARADRERERQELRERRRDEREQDREAIWDLWDGFMADDHADAYLPDDDEPVEWYSTRR